MKRPGRARMAAVLVAVALLAAGTTSPLAQAAESEAPPREPLGTSATRNAGTTIDSARRDLEAVKSLRSTTGMATGELPRFGLPGIPTERPVSPSPAPPAKTDTKRASSNWLLEAMEQRDAPSSRDGRATGWVASERKRTEDRESPGGQRRSGGDLANAERTPILNPFARYLDQWMTAQDYALLKPALTQSPAMESVRAAPYRGSDAATASLPPLAGVPESFEDPAVMDRRGPRRSSPPAANPYLALEPRLPGGTAPGVQLPPPVVPALPSKLGTSMAKPPDAAALPSAPASRIPSFVKPDDDEKYFKPLKRF